MAADNYSDVIQTLAREIVHTCSKLASNSAQGAISNAKIDASQITGDTSVITGGGGGMASGVMARDVVGLNQVIADAIASGTINLSQIIGFDEQVGLLIDRATINYAQITELEAQIARIAAAYIDRAEIDTAHIRDLNAEVARISAAILGKANIVSADIDTAHIDWAEIQNLIAENTIITRGIGDKLYITDLAVTEANIVSLSVGELIIKGQDGSFYTFSIDSEGHVVTTKKEVSNDDIANLSIDGDTKLIEGSITAKTLNVQDIFANSALIKQIIAENIDVGTLFARQATIDAINTMDITGNTYLKLFVGNEAQQAIIDMDPASIVQKVESVKRFQESFETQYYLSDSNSELVGGEWKNTPDKWTPGKYMWIRSAMHYTDGSTSYTEPYCDSNWNGTSNLLIGSRNYIPNSKDLILEGTHRLVSIMDNEAFVGTALVDYSVVASEEPST